MSRRSAIKVAIVVLSVVTVFEVYVRRTTAIDEADSRPPVAIAEEDPMSRSVDEPRVDLRALDVLDPTPGSERPPARHQWAGSGAVPTNQWWSPALLGPGSLPLWARPLAVSIDANGTIGLANAPAQFLDADTWISPPGPVIRIRPSVPLETSVEGAGDFHVSLSLDGSSGSVDVDVVKGQPFVELDTAVELVIEGGVVEPRDGRVEITVGEQRWFLITDGGTVEADAAAARFGSGRLLVGVVPDGADDAWWDAVTAIVAAPLVDSIETMTVEDGAVRQELRVERSADFGAKQPFLLLDHQQPVDGVPVGELVDRNRRRTVVSADAVETRVDTPVLWRLGGAESFDSDAWQRDLDATTRRTGSYFGGKDALTMAMLADLARANGQSARFETAADLAAEHWKLLADGTEPRATIESNWGAVIVSPAEFGSGTDLNDHHLQYSYWVAAASYLAEWDPAWAAANGSLVDTLIADYGGTAALGVVDDRLPTHRTWDAYEGHGWASGTAPFADGNNLESTSESALAWWAAARWFVVTDRPSLAAPYLGRHGLEVESARVEMLPTGEATGRPWGGIAWGGKQDPNTFFSATDEAALGIKLLPLGPMSVSRYRDADDIAAAERRWEWCAANGGCGELWPNLLRSDAAIARRLDVLDGASGDAETTTPATISAWWESMWSGARPVGSASCSPGAMLVRTDGGDFVVHASNPSSVPVQMQCRDTETGVTRWTRILAPGEQLTAQV